MDEITIFELDELIIRNLENKDIDVVKMTAKNPLFPLITTVLQNFSQKVGMEYIERQKNKT